MTPFDGFLLELDRLWTAQRKASSDRIPFKIIGSVALMLQVSYLRGTKDGDVLKTIALSPEIQEKLLAIGGMGTNLAIRHGIYLDIVPSGLPFLPRPAIYHPVERLNTVLENFRVEALDVVDVVVSKLKRFNANDRKDIEEMVNRGLVDPERLVERFRTAAEGFSMSAYADDLPVYAARLNQVERDWLYTDETPFNFED